MPFGEDCREHGGVAHYPGSCEESLELRGVEPVAEAVLVVAGIFVAKVSDVGLPDWMVLAGSDQDTCSPELDVRETFADSVLERSLGRWHRA